MKKSILLIVIALFVGLSGYAQPPAGDAKKGDSYGEKITDKGAISLAELGKQLDKKDSVTAKIKGKVLEVCSKKGCWVSMELPDKSKVFVKFKDYGFFVPTALSGKTVVLDGFAKKKIRSVNELKHYAEDAGKSQAEIDAITKPEKEISFLADGVLVI